MYHHHRHHHPFTPERYVTFCAYLQRMLNILFESECLPILVRFGVQQGIHGYVKTW